MPTTTDPYATSTAAGTNPYKTQKATNASEQVLGLYQSNFGRSASSPEVETWIKNAGGGAYLNNDQLNYIQGEFKKAPEYTQYGGTRPTVAQGDFIGGVTLGTKLADDPYFKQAATPTTGGGLTNVTPATGSILTPTPLPGTTSGETALENRQAASDETTTLGMQSLLRDTLINQLTAKPPSMDDPNLRGAMSAFQAAQNKATARQVAQNAEAFGASGLESSGARLAADRGAIEQQGLNEGQFGSQLMLGELNAQRQQAQQALQSALAMNDQDLARRLQEQLANLNAAVQRESLAQTGRLGDADIALRGKLGQGNLNLGLLSLLENGRQFNNGLGFNMANAEAMLNNTAVRTLLGY
jgi:hypothetical protein